MTKSTKNQTNGSGATVRISVVLPRTEARKFADGSFTLQSPWDAKDVNAADKALRTVQAAAKRALD